MVIGCNNYVLASHFKEFYLNHRCLGNVHINFEIDASIRICYTLNALVAYELNAMITLPQNSTYAGSFLHGLHIWSNDVMLCAKPQVYAIGREPS